MLQEGYITRKMMSRVVKFYPQEKVNKFTMGGLARIGKEFNYIFHALITPPLGGV